MTTLPPTCQITRTTFDPKPSQYQRRLIPARPLLFTSNRFPAVLVLAVFVLCVVLSSDLLAEPMAQPRATPASQRNVQLFPLVNTDTPRSVRAEFDLTMSPGAHGVGVLFYDAPGLMPGVAPDIKDFSEPNLDFKANPFLRHSIAIAFDTHNPPTTDRFNADGNIYARPQREISLHVADRERMNLLSPEDFATGKPVRVLVGFRFVPGGALVALRVGQTVVLDAEFVANVEPFIPALVIGTTEFDTHDTARVDNVIFVVDGQLDPPFPPPVRLDVLNATTIHGLKQSVAQIVDLPEGEFARVLAHVRLTKPQSGDIDKWDRRAALYLTGPDAQRYELMRFVTPFARPWEWTADITDFLPLLRGRRELSLFVDTWSGGFEAQVWLEFFPGKPARTPVAVVNLWQGEPLYGDASQPIEHFLTDRIVLIPPTAKGAKIRLAVTGHGQAPNTDNAAEFMPIHRTLKVGPHAFNNLLWTRDNYLNPCRPQGGTWKFDRAGWGPGRLVQPWTIDITNLLLPGQKTLELQYITQPYTNRNKEPAVPPTLWFDGVVVFYAD